MILPERPNKHITETSSFKIFSNNIPDSWIIREVTERDYGIDCYIELVNGRNQVTGDLISIQLKGLNGIDWTRDDYYTFSGINLSTTNYWHNFPTPVFICLVDIQTKEVFFCPVKTTIRKNFLIYAKQEKFTYRIEKNSKLEISNLRAFLLAYFKEKQLDDLEKNITTFISHYQQYKEFIDDNIGRDCFMGVENNRILYLKHFYNNLRFLCNYFDIKWDLKPLRDYFKISQERFGKDYDIYEQQIDEIATELDKLMIPILLELKEYITVQDKEYWILVDLHLFNIMGNVQDDGTMPYDY
jgi:hypothetical protein